MQSQVQSSNLTVLDHSPSIRIQSDALAFKNTHLPQIDVLRGVAILIVFSLHLLGVACERDYLPWVSHWRDLAMAPEGFLAFYPYTYGWIGVRLFFVISGFCIHLSFLSWTTKNQAKMQTQGWFKSYLGSFFQRRLWRIYPAYFIALIAFTLYNQVDITQKKGFIDFFSHLFLLNNLSKPTFYGYINGSFWSVSVEWQLYLLYPLILLAGLKVGIRKVFVGILCLTLLLNQIDISSENYLILKSPFFYWYEWTLGAVVAQYWMEGKKLFTVSKSKLVFVLISVLVIASFCKPIAEWQKPLSTLICAIVLEGYIHQVRPLNRLEKGLAMMGLLSYSIYLLHQPLIPGLLRAIHMIPFLNNVHLDLSLNGILILIPIVLLSYLSYRWIELPGIRFGKALQARGQLKPRLSSP